MASPQPVQQAAVQPCRLEGSDPTRLSSDRFCFGSPPSSNSISNCTATASVTASAGYAELSGRLRSALIHPVGLPLLCFLNRTINTSAATGEDLDSRKGRGKAAGGAGTGTEPAEKPLVDKEPLLQHAPDAPASASTRARTVTTTRDHIERLYSTKVASLVFESTSNEYSDVFSKTYEEWRQSSETYVKQLAQYEAAHDEWKEKVATYRALPRRETAKTNAPREPARPSSESNEALLTSALLTNISDVLESVGTTGPTIVVDDQFSVGYDSDKPSNYSATDVTLWRQEEEDEHSLLLLAEVGIACDWWKKASQNAQHMDAIQCEHGSRAGTKRRHGGGGARRHTFSKPTLFAVVTFWPTKEKAFRSASLGVFLCVPAADGKDFRVALLSRSAPQGLDEMSRDFGRVIRAAALVPALLGAISEIGARHFRSLGPNCCRVRNSVLRAYDSRFRPSFRRSDLYFDKEINPGSIVICNLDDRTGKGDDRSQAVQPAISTATAASAAADPIGKVAAKKEKRNRLFEFEGKLEIIETPFYQGKHYARSPQDIVPVVQFLRDMHRKDYVHGDIRCFNIVFGKRLIDFDFGGKVSASVTPTYPKGYAFVLPSRDGNRRGRAGGPMTKVDDVFALTQAIFACHDFIPPAEEPTQRSPTVESPCTTEKSGRATTLDSPRADSQTIENLKKFPLGKRDPVKQLNDLMEFLEKVQVEGWSVEPNANFRMGLSECGLSVSIDDGRPKDDDIDNDLPFPAGTCPTATGSPNERRREC